MTQLFTFMIEEHSGELGGKPPFKHIPYVDSNVSCS